MTINPYIRRQLNGWKPVGDTEAPKPTRKPYRAELGRAMTEHERRLEAFAQKDGIAGLVTVWHMQADGTYSGFEILMPDAGRMAVIGTIAKDGGNG